MGTKIQIRKQCFAPAEKKQIDRLEPSARSRIRTHPGGLKMQDLKMGDQKR